MASQALNIWTAEDNRKMNEWKRKSRLAIQTATTPESLLKALIENCSTMQRVKTWLQFMLWSIEDGEASKENIAKTELFQQTFAIA